ncbi:MAG: PD40 domain-containing protein [Acidobacteria bacterium]|nr:PD40 domain-containing protein [Acidobacteriota bacterium]
MLSILLLAPCLVLAQGPVELEVTRSGQTSPRIAVPDLPGFVGTDVLRTFNATLWNDLEAAGTLEMVAKSFYPRSAPTKPDEVKFGSDQLPTDPGARGPWLMGWSEPPVTARYLVFGQLEKLNDRLVLNGYLYDATATETGPAYMLGKRYYSDLTETGAQQIAHDFSREILETLGLGMGLAGSRIYFVSDRTGQSEIWSMDYDGQNLKQHTNYNNITITPAVSADGSRLAFTSYADGLPKIYVHSLETGRKLTFYNQDASLNTTPDFTPDGKSIAYASSITGRSQIYMADLDGRNLRRISYSRSLDVDPVVNPKTGAQIAFVSDRPGTPQVYLMDMDGANVRRLSLGGGDAVQPAWDPQGANVAFSWTRGFEPGNYNVFVINVATQKLTQLTHGAGRNENPVFSPSGTHIVFTSDRSGGTQIWTMRADGTQVKRLTTQGRNRMPVWGSR